MSGLGKKVRLAVEALRAFGRMLEINEHSIFRSPEEVFQWWVQTPNYFPGQLSFGDMP